jgi:hypothetical protein
MARNRQDYEDVMDVKLRWTLKELGFKKKSHATYIHERPKVTRVFELHPDKWGCGFYDEAGVLNHEMERISQNVLRSILKPRGHMRTRTHADASISKLLTIEVHGGPTHPIDVTLYKDPPKVSYLLEYRDGGLWLPRMNPKGIYDNDEIERIFMERATAFGLYLDEMFRRYVLPWYELCDDPVQFAQWYEDHVRPSRPKILGAIIAHHLAGNDDRAAKLLSDLIAECEQPNEQVLREVERRKGVRRWMHWSMLRRVYKPEQYEEEARGFFEGNKIAAAEAYRLADAFGIAI